MVQDVQPNEALKKLMVLHFRHRRLAGTTAYTISTFRGQTQKWEPGVRPRGFRGVVSQSRAVPAPEIFPEGDHPWLQPPANAILAIIPRKCNFACKNSWTICGKTLTWWMSRSSRPCSKLPPKC